jgi:hypothetical protein
VGLQGSRRRRGAVAYRAAYRICYVVMLVTGVAAARLAADFRTLGAARARLGPLRVVLQVPVLACWMLVRPISLAAFAGCCELAPRVSGR